MLKAHLPRVLNLDDSVASRSAASRGAAGAAALPALSSLEHAQVRDLRALAPELRYLCSRAALRRFREALSPADRSRLTFYGSGDFHHLTAELLRAFTSPLSLIVFDQHPDWDCTLPWPCCGSWVNSALQLEHIRRVVVIGLGREDLHGWNLLRGNTRALREGRLELYPASWRISREPRGYRRFQTVRSRGMSALLSQVLARLPTRQVYVSVDKDCLGSAWAASNWAEGELELPELLGAIAQIGAARDIVGADVTGEWSPGEPRSPLFRAISRADHPKILFPNFAQLRANAGTNRALQAAFAAATSSS